MWKLCIASNGTSKLSPQSDSKLWMNCRPEDAFDWPAGSGAMLAFLPTLVIWDSVLRGTKARLLPMDPTPLELAVWGGTLGAGGGMAPLALGCEDTATSLCLLATAVAAFTATCKPPVWVCRWKQAQPHKPLYLILQLYLDMTAYLFMWPSSLMSLRPFTCLPIYVWQTSACNCSALALMSVCEFLLHVFVVAQRFLWQLLLPQPLFLLSVLWVPWSAPWSAIGAYDMMHMK